MTASVDPEGPPLQRAAGAGRVDVLEELLTAGEELNQQNELGQTALHVACSAGHVAAANALLARGADAGVRDFRHETALIKAAKSGHVSIVELFLKHTPPEVGSEPAGGGGSGGGATGRQESSLLWGLVQTVTARPKRAIRSLLSRINPTAAAAAAAASTTLGNHTVDNSSSGRSGSAGGDGGGVGGGGGGGGVGGVGGGGMRILKRGGYHRPWTDGQNNSRLGPCWEAVLRAAAVEGHVQIERLLLQYDIEVNAVDINGATALAIAAGYGHVDFMALLLQHGASANRKDAEGETPLLKAAWGGHIDAIRLLLQYGVSINQSDSEGMTALHFAARKGNPATVRFLLQEGADVHRMTGQGVTYCVDYPMLSGATPLHMAAWRGHWLILRDILEAGGDLDAVTLMGQTCLHIATDTALYSGERHRPSKKAGPCTEAMSYLLNKGCRMNTVDVDGNTPLDLTWTIGGHPRVALTLLSHGARFSPAKMADFRYLLLEDSGAELHLAVCRAVLLSGNHGNFSVPSSGGEASILFDRLQALGAVDDFSAWLHRFLFTPRPLRDLARLFLRQWFVAAAHDDDRSIWRAMQELPLPMEMKEFVLLKDLSDTAAAASECGNLHYSCDSSSYENASQSACSNLTDPED